MIWRTATAFTSRLEPNTCLGSILDWVWACERSEEGFEIAPDLYIRHRENIKRERKRRRKRNFHLRVVNYSKWLYPQSKSLFDLIIKGISNLLVRDGTGTALFPSTLQMVSICWCDITVQERPIDSLIQRWSSWETDTQPRRKSIKQLCTFCVNVS